MSSYLDIDPNLKLAADEIRAVLKKHSIAGAFQIASSTHAEFGMELPEWSAIWFQQMENGDRAMRVKSSKERDGVGHLESSLHCILSMRDTCAEQAAYLIQVGDALMKVLKDAGVEIEHKTFQQQVREAHEGGGEEPAQ